MNNDNQYKKSDMNDMIEMYVLGGLDQEEQERFEAYLQEDEQCRLAVEELREVMDILPFAVEDVAPPIGMKSRVLSHILTPSHTEQVTSDDRGTTPIVVEKSSDDHTVKPAVVYSAQDDKAWAKDQGKHKFWRIATTLVAAAAVIIGVYASNLRGEIDSLHQQLAISSTQVNSLQGKLATVSMPTQGLKVDKAVKLNPATADIVAQGLATIVIDDKGTHLLVQADNLPKLKGKEAFQVWLIKGDVKQSAGTFLTQDGTGAMYYTFQPEDYDTIAITLEPDKQGDQPRGPIVLAAEIQG